MKKGYFGEFGGCFVPELLMPPLLEVEAAMRDIMPTQQFQDELQDLLHNYAGRPTPLTFCPRLSEELGFELWLKREDLLHSGAHKINNTLGQALLAKYMGKTALVAETGAGQHGVATAVAAARLGMSCTIYMGAEDVERQAPNVMRMRLLGATVHPVESGSRTLKDAINEALRAWIVSQQTTHYCFGTAAGPHPFPTLVRMFQQVIGQEVREQMLARARRLPDAVVACVGGGSNAIGLFAGFVDDADVRLIGVEPAGRGLTYGDHAASLCKGEPGVMHGFHSYMIKDENGEPGAVYSISAGLDYPSVGPEHSYLKDIGRAEYVSVTDKEAVDAFFLLSRTEGIIPALESSHALAQAVKVAPTLPKDTALLVCLSGRGDKDVGQMEAFLESAK